MASLSSLSCLAGKSAENPHDLIRLSGSIHSPSSILCRRPILGKYAFDSRLSRPRFGHAKYVVAAGGGGDHEESGGETDAVLKATIKTNKKVLAMKKEVLQQIEERRQIVSSMKNIIINSEEKAELCSESFNLSYQYLPSTYEELDLNCTEENISESFAQLTASDSSKASISEVNRDLDKDKKLQNNFLMEKVSSALDFQNELHETSQVTAAPLSVLQKSKSFCSIDEGCELPEKNIAENVSDRPLTTAQEDVKPSPLAGANVMNVILVAAECTPWSKTGGLGDVAGALPKALARRGHRVMVVVPRYGHYPEVQDTGVRRRYSVGHEVFDVTYFQAYIDGVDFVFIDGNPFHNHQNDVYGGQRLEILKRMVLFCKAAVEIPWHVPCGGACYGDGNLVFIANDWHTALLPVYLKAYYRDNGLMKYTRSILVIHNIAHQGRGPMEEFDLMDLPMHYKNLFAFYDPLGGDHLNIFAAGLKTADRIVTVSHGYSWELKTSEGGWGLHGIINENDWKFKGIVNGIDPKEWSPQVDVHLKSDGYANYSLETLKTGKSKCKAALQKELGLPVREDVPLIGFIGRLDYQKGVDLIAEAIPWLVSKNVQLVMLGTGRADLENMLRHFDSSYHDHVRGWVGFSVKMSHRITAGADILLMPSRFEPCGLNQLYAMSYGTVPVVHAVGGLRDTVQPFDPYNESGLGWTFDRAETHKLKHALENCLLTYREFKSSWEGIQRRGMMQDLSWDNSAQHYEEVLLAAKYQW